jgi:hypothetical protein
MGTTRKEGIESSRERGTEFARETAEKKREGEREGEKRGAVAAGQTRSAISCSPGDFRGLGSSSFRSIRSSQ